MTIYVQLIVFWICIYTCLFTEGVGFYISTSTNTWHIFPQDCRLAQPEYVHAFDTGKINLKKSIPLNETQQHDVWIGYVKAFTEFKYHGCSELSISGLRNVKSLVDCNYACTGKYFGLHCSNKTLKCMCVDQLPDDITSKSCATLDGFVCGTNRSLAIYSAGTDKTSINRNTISNLCKASPSNFNDAAWVKCYDKNHTRNMWCRKDENSGTILSERKFVAWNEANDYCAEKHLFPSTAVGYNDIDIYKMAFTNIFRNWTLKKGNGSISGGPMMFAYVKPNSTEIKFSDNSTDSKNFLCLGPKPTSPPTTQTTHTTQETSPTTKLASTVKPLTSTITTHSHMITTSKTNRQTSGSTHTSRKSVTTATEITLIDTATSPQNIQSTTFSSTTDGSSESSKQQASQGGSLTTAISAGVPITVAIAVSVVVIVLVLRNKKKACFANTKMSKLENRNDNIHITLARVESKPTAYYQTPGTSVSNKTYSALQNASTCTKDADKYNPVAYTDVTCQNTNITQKKHDSEARAYFVLDTDGFEQQRSAINANPAEVHDYFVLEKQQPNIGNSNDLSTNDVHSYFVLEKEGDRPFHDIPPQAGDAYFVLEKQTKGNSPPIKTANAHVFDNCDGDTYQEIDTNDTYASIDDSREDNVNDYDYANKGFEDSRKETSDNIYNHLNTAGDEYDHVGKGQSNANAMENSYVVTSGAVRK